MARYLFTPKGEVKELSLVEYTSIDADILNPFCEEVESELLTIPEYREAIKELYALRRTYPTSHDIKLNVTHNVILDEKRNNQNMEELTERTRELFQQGDAEAPIKEIISKHRANVSRKYSRKVRDSYKDNLEDLKRQIILIIGLNAYTLYQTKNAILDRILSVNEKTTNTAKKAYTMMQAVAYKIYFTANNCKKIITRGNDNLYVYIDYLKAKNPIMYKEVNDTLKATTKSLLKLTDTEKAYVEILNDSYERQAEVLKESQQEKINSIPYEYSSFPNGKEVDNVLTVIANNANLEGLIAKQNKIDKHTIVKILPSKDGEIDYTTVSFITRKNGKERRVDIRINNKDVLTRSGLASKVFIWGMMEVVKRIKDNRLITNTIISSSTALANDLGYKNSNSLTNQLSKVFPLLQNLQVYVEVIKNGKKLEKQWTSIFRKIHLSQDGTFTIIVEDLFPLKVFTNAYAYLPRKMLTLSNHACNMVMVICHMIRQNMLEKGKDERRKEKFVISFRTLHKYLSLKPLEECQRVGTEILKPIYKAIEDVEESDLSKDFDIEIKEDESLPPVDRFLNGSIVVTPIGEYVKYLDEQYKTLSTTREKMIKKNMLMSEKNNTKKQQEKEQREKSLAKQQALQQGALERLKASKKAGMIGNI